MLNIIQKRNIWLTLSGTMVSLSIIAIALWGLNFGIDFTGGSLLEVEFSDNRPAVNDVQVAIADLQLNSLIVQPIGDKGMALRFQNVDEEKHQEILNKLRELVSSESEKKDNNAKDSVTEIRFDSVGSTVGNEFKSKSFNAIVLSLIAIILFVAWAFRKVSKPVASWRYGLAAVIALFHDIIITIGVFAYLGEFYNVEINAPFVAAILTVLGYSVNDTIVVFDRIRENLPKSNETFEDTVNISINQTITRSINTSLATLLTILAIIFYGGETIRSFVVALAIGIFVGTYSSIFLASPMLVVWEKLKKH